MIRRSKSHGHTGIVNGKRFRSPTYIVWAGMRQRCRDSRHRYWMLYGGRGITVCDRWHGSDGFEHFLEDMGERPEGRSLDRIDSNGNYEPGNCRWATQAEQIQNSSKAKMNFDLVQEIRGRAEHGECTVSIAKRVGLNPVSVRKIVRRESWSNIP